MRVLREVQAGSDVHYSWVNVTCRHEWLRFLDVDPSSYVPTLALYYP